MKKVLFILLVSLGLAFGAKAQVFVQGGVGVKSKVFTQNLEVGKAGANQISLIGETSDNKHFYERQYFAGVKYARNFKSGLQASGAALIHLNRNTYDLQFEPGVAYNVKLGEGISLVPRISTPISENTKLFSPVSLSAGVDLRISL